MKWLGSHSSTGTAESLCPPPPTSPPTAPCCSLIKTRLLDAATTKSCSFLAVQSHRSEKWWSSSDSSLRRGDQTSCHFLCKAVWAHKYQWNWCENTTVKHRLTNWRSLLCFIDASRHKTFISLIHLHWSKSPWWKFFLQFVNRCCWAAFSQSWQFAALKADHCLASERIVLMGRPHFLVQEALACTHLHSLALQSHMHAAQSGLISKTVQAVKTHRKCHHFR